MPFAQICDPNWQSPTSVLTPHALVSPLMQVHPSLATPLQLASSPCTAQESRGAGGTAPTHSLKAPSVQVLLPIWQIPSSVAEPQG
jgi:hypothetical protein